MYSVPVLPIRLVATLFLAALAITAVAQTSSAPKPPVREDRVFLKDVEGIWINEAYLKELVALKSPHAAATKSPPLVIAIHREGRTYPIVVTDFNQASLQVVLDIEPDGKAGAYRLVVAADDKPTSSKDVKYIRFEGTKNAQGKFEKLRLAEPDFMKGKWADYVPINGELNPRFNALVIAGRYRDAKGATWTFSEAGEASWPGQKFNYELSLNDPAANCDYLQTEDAGKTAEATKGGDNKLRYGFHWKAGKLSVYATRLAGRRVVCDTRPIAVLTPQ